MTTKKKTHVTIDGEVWEVAGIVAVDTGQILVTDPCRLPFGAIGGANWDSEKDLVRPDLSPAADGKLSYSGACRATMSEPRYGQLEGGVALATGYGDGVYPVLVRRTEDGHIAEMRIVFVDEEAPDA